MIHILSWELFHQIGSKRIARSETHTYKCSSRRYLDSWAIPQAVEYLEPFRPLRLTLIFDVFSSLLFKTHCFCNTGNNLVPFPNPHRMCSFLYVCLDLNMHVFLLFLFTAFNILLTDKIVHVTQYNCFPKKKVIWVWNYMRVSKRWQNDLFWVNYPFKHEINGSLSILLWVTGKKKKFTFLSLSLFSFFFFFSCSLFLAVRQSLGCNWSISYLSSSPCHGTLGNSDILLTHTLRYHDSCGDTLAQSL